MSSPVVTNEKMNRSLSEFEFVHDPSDKSSKLGVGSFATVKLAKEKKTGRLYAIKIISMNPSKITSSDLHNIKTEISIHRKLDHPNIIKFHDYLQKEHNVYIILDYAETGNLYSYIHKRKSLSKEEVFRFFYQTCLAIQYLHKNDVLHRDVKPENLLLDKNRDIKLCDFGWSTRRITEKRLTFCGTYEYMAPEIVHKKPYDYRVDIWSLGVLLFELIHKEAPYKGRSLNEISKSLAKSQINFDPNTHPDAKDLILKILKTNPNDRLSIAQILSHPWVKASLPKESVMIHPNETKTSPRELKLNTIQSMFCESPKVQMRRNKENFKSEIISSGDTFFTEQSIPQTKKNQNVDFFNSFNGNSTLKESEKSKEKGKEQVLLTENAAPAPLHCEPQKRKPLKEFGSNIQLKTASDYLPKGHTKSSSSLNSNILERLIVDDRKSPSHFSQKKKIFENNLLSPALKPKVNSIICHLSSQTTTNKSKMETSLLTNRTQQTDRNCYNPLTMTSRYLHDNPSNIRQNTDSQIICKTKPDIRIDENCKYTIVHSLNSSKARVETENPKSSNILYNQGKNCFQVKLNLLKGDEVPILYSPNRTARNKGETLSSEPSESQNNGMSFSYKFSHQDFVKSALNQISENSLASAENKHKLQGHHDRSLTMTNFYKIQETSRRKHSSKFGEELQSPNHHLLVLKEKKDQKEKKKDMVRDKENKMIIKEECGRNWAC